MYFRTRELTSSIAASWYFCSFWTHSRSRRDLRSCKDIVWRRAGGVEIVRSRTARRTHACCRISRNVRIAVSSSRKKISTIHQWFLILTTLNFYPWRSSTVALYDTVHQEFFPGNERVGLFYIPLYRMSPSLDGVEQTSSASILSRCT